VVGGVSSLLATGWWVAQGHRSEPHGATALLWLLEAGGLLVLIFLVVRWSSPPAAVTGALVAGTALPLSLLRFGSLTSASVLGCCAWALGGAVAALAGGYLRALNTGRERAVEQARLQQRLELANDLHDFVAHDVSEILAQAQAAQILATTEPGRLPLALERIRAAAARALDTLDQTVHGVAAQGPAAEGAEPAASGSIQDIPLLVNRFQSSGTVRVELRLEDDAVAAVDGPTGRALYRAVVEALTNVRRHAGEADQVRIRLRTGPVAGQVELSVTDDAAHDARCTLAGVRAGRGLPALAGRVQELGGAIWAGPGDPSGWRLRVTVPAAPGAATPAPDGSR
jgi:signal transduction histidine kinase